MSGELILKRSSCRQTALALAAASLLSGGVMLALMSVAHLQGMTLAIGAAVLVYVLFRVFYPSAVKLLPQQNERLKWTLTDTALFLGQKEIPLASIKTVHCWPNRDALGNVLGGWTVNIETTGKNHLLRSLKEGPDMERSVNSLHELVEAMGYGRNWKEQ